MKSYMRLSLRSFEIRQDGDWTRSSDRFGEISAETRIKSSRNFGAFLVEFHGNKYSFSFRRSKRIEMKTAI